MDLIVGIDPGLSGGFCLLELPKKTLYPTQMEFIPFPTLGSDIDFRTLSSIFTQFSGAYACVEKVSSMPNQGVASMFKFGRAYGALQAMLAAYKIPFEEVTPQKWQKAMFEGVPEQFKKPGKDGKQRRDTKAMSLIAARRLFPHPEIKKDWQSDSILIAEWCRRKFISDLTAQDLVS